MKKLVPFFLIFVLIFTSLACSSSTPKPEPTATAKAASPTAAVATEKPQPTSIPLTPTPVPVKLGDIQQVEDGGFSFRTIPGFSLEVNGGMAMMLGPKADPDTGPVVQLIGYWEEDEGTAEGLYNQLKSQASLEVSPAEPITVGGIPGLAANISGEEDGAAMLGRVALVMVNSNQQFMLLAGSPQEEWEALAPYFDAVLASIEFFELAAPAPTSDLEPGWYAYTDINAARDVLIHENTAYAATLGGLAAWNLDSGYVMRYTPLQGMGHVSAYAAALCNIPEPRILVGTLAGISIYDPATGLWEERDLAPAESRVNLSKISRLVCDTQHQRLYIGYNGLGILDLVTGEWQQYTSDNGLSWNGVSDIAVSANGEEVWVASGYNGVAQIKGGAVTVHNKASGLPDERVYAVAAAADGSVWAGASSGLMQFKGGKWTLFGSGTPAALAEVSEIELAADGKIWVTTAPWGAGRLCQFDPASKTCPVDLRDPDGEAIFGLDLTEDGSPVYVTEQGVFQLKDGQIQAFKDDSVLLASNFVDAFAAAADGRLWVGTDYGIQLMDPAAPETRWETFRSDDNPGLGGNWANDIAVADDGTTWFAITNGNASRYKDGTWSSYEPLRSYDTVTVDDENRAWFGDSGKGIAVLNADGSPAFNLTTADGLPSDNVMALLAQDDVVWIGTDSGLARFANGKVSVVLAKNDPALPFAYIRELVLDPDGNLLIGANLAVVRYDGAKAETLLNLSKQKDADWLTTLAAAPDGRIWVGTARGIFYSDDSSSWTHLTTADRLLTNYISALHVDQYGTAWIGGGGSNMDGGGILHIVP
ncbi:MAG TPA: hypothetical protein PKW33_10910 [Anaerolineaceae bacterium]|nr:hypothetical protein [Anaerolineaceae bacterium]HPN52088.1 hypothetical protein [Anaerolineaceae bacterium]